ncbi:isocitrate lyase/phosphoenolpyruvate mutase family protein [Bacillus cereus group sp. TH230-1LC]|nr:isocitrate lyase/phosphoenolpyruvate mutase family protein [Bacillus cereus group sp. TH230-1LC]
MNDMLMKSKIFNDYHHDSSILILPNAWDVMSAKIYEDLNYRAIGTTSAGIAASLGYSDGEQLPFESMLDVIKKITKSVNIPVSADIESGYGETLEEVLENVRKIIASGVVGVNLEDSKKNHIYSLYDTAYQQTKIERIKNVSISEGVSLFINARTDAYIFSNNGVEETIKRAQAYKDAGADGIFIPGLTQKEHIHMFTKKINLPLNVLIHDSTPSIPDLECLNVSRISFGSGAYRATISTLRKLASEVIMKGQYETMTNDVISYENMVGFLHKN